MQEYIRRLLRPTPLQQPAGPLQPCLRALLESARPLPVSARPLLVSAPWMPDVPRLLSQPRVAVPESETAEHENQDGRRSEMYFSERTAGVQRDVLTPHSTTVAQTTSALAPRAARGDPLVAWPGGLGHSRGAATASETAEQDFLSGLRGPQDGQDFGGGPGAGLLDALAPHSTTTAPDGTTPALAPRAYSLSASCCCDRERKFRLLYFSRAPFSRWNTRFQYGPCFSCYFSYRHRF